MYESKARNIDEYIKEFPENIQEKLEQIRQTIRKTAPQASEKISYQIPTFYLNGNLVHFAAFKDHLSFFPGGEAVEFFKDKLIKYKTSKGTIQLPLDQPLPLELISEIVKHQVSVNLSSPKKK